MNDAVLKRCAEWSVLLAANPEHLTSEEHRALADHLATCQACRRAQADFALQDAFLRQQPTPAPLAGLPPKILAAWAVEDEGALPGGAPGVPLKAGARHAGRRSRRFAGMMSAVAAVLVVALLVSALVVSHLPTSSHPTGQVTQTPGTATPTAEAATPTATPGPDGTWVTPPGLENLKGEPILAPSNPAIIYQVLSTDGQTTAPIIKRSDDGGATWHSLLAPFAASGQVFGVTLAVSPLDAQVVVLQVAYYASVNMPTTCPDKPASGGLRAARAGFSLCYLHYLSRDGGRDWQGLVLPVTAQDQVNSTLIRMGSYPAFGGPLLLAQGARLYAILGASGGMHLIVSVDEGQTWRLDDAGIGVAGRYICDSNLLPAPDGAVIFALVYTQSCGSGGTQELWRSDDAGATWHRAGPLPGPAAVDAQAFVVSSQGSRAMPLIYLFKPTSLGAPSDMKVSTDGGETWLLAPDEGMQAGLYTFTGPLGVLGDGSVLAGVQTPLPTQPYLATALYRWKVGEAAWHEVAPAVEGTPDYVLVTGQPETIWQVISNQRMSFLVQRLSRP